MQKHHFYHLSVKFSLTVPLSVSTVFHPGCQDTTINATLVSGKFVWEIVGSKFYRKLKLCPLRRRLWGKWREVCDGIWPNFTIKFLTETLKENNFYNKCNIMKLNWDLRWYWNKYVRRYYDREKMAALGWIYCAGGWSTMGRLLGRMDRGPESPGYGGIIRKWNIGTTSICWQWQTEKF